MELEVYKSDRKCLSEWLNTWTTSSPIVLEYVETRILSFLKLPYDGFFVDISSTGNKADKIWTISMNTDSKETPIVLLHGLAAGVALWVLNLDTLAKDHPVYAMDVLGFGRSSRPKFSTDPLICEKQFVEAIEEWRRKLNIEKMILLGHSMGGFIVSSYTLSYPERVQHLILADPWGFPEKPSETGQVKQVPSWARLLTTPNPLSMLRAIGPFGQWAIKKARPDIIDKFSVVTGDDRNLIPHYIHQCNAQQPSGETAFDIMMDSFRWAKYPMINRIKDIHQDIPITFIYGSQSWLDLSSSEKIEEQRGSSMVDIKIIVGAGHHVYADIPEDFNRFVLDVCDLYKVRE